MRKLILLSLSVAVCISTLNAQKPACTTNPTYRQLDFWIGEWEVYNSKTGQRAGDSKIEAILDSCTILENWRSTRPFNGLTYSGKSFNIYNSVAKQWQQTWVDNFGSTIQYVEGRYEDKKMIYKTNPFPMTNDTMAVRRLTFFDLGPDKVRQFGEISKDNEKTWVPEYDLEYRRKK